MKGRVLSLDVGDRRIGIAVSDENRLIAQPHSVYTRVGYGPDVKHIADLCKKLGTNELVCGFPRNMDGSIGYQARKVQDLGEKLIEAGFIVNYQDERMSTVSAERVLIEGGMRREDRRQTVDKIAAAVILQNYLDTYNNNREDTDNMSDELMNGTPEDENNIVELTDEEGVVSQFEYIMTLEHEKNSYVVLIELNEEKNDHEEDEEGDVVHILRIDKDPKTGEDIYVSVEDESIEQEVYDKFLIAIDEDGNNDEGMLDE